MKMRNFDEPSYQTAIPSVSGLIHTSDELEWDGLKLSYWQNVPPQEASEPLTSNLLVIHTTPQAVPTLERGEGYHSEGLARPGDLNLIGANETTFCRWEKPLSFIRLELSPKFLQNIALQTALTNPDRLELHSRYRHQDQRIVQVGQWLLEEVRAGNPGGKLYADSLANVLAIHLLSSYTTPNKTTQPMPGQLSRQQVTQAIAYMNGNYNQNISLEEIGQAVNVSPSYLIKLFKQATDLSPHQYLIKLRVEQAQQLLAGGQLSISEVAAQVGFADQSHLHRHFKNRLGVTPKTFLTSLT